MLNINIASINGVNCTYPRVTTILPTSFYLKVIYTNHIKNILSFQVEKSSGLKYI